MALTKERIGEISWTLLKLQMKHGGISNFKVNDTKRKLGNLEKETGISREELREFGLKLFKEASTEFITGVAEMKL